MGGNMVRRLLAGGHQVVRWDRDANVVARARQGRMTPASSLADVAGKLSPPRAVWVMVPVGRPDGRHDPGPEGVLAENDILIDGGNSNYKDSVRREELAEKKIRFLDAGTSGGVWGREERLRPHGRRRRSAYQHVLPALTTSPRRMASTTSAPPARPLRQDGPTTASSTR